MTTEAAFPMAAAEAWGLMEQTVRRLREYSVADFESDPALFAIYVEVCQALRLRTIRTATYRLPADIREAVWCYGGPAACRHLESYTHKR